MKAVVACRGHHTLRHNLADAHGRDCIVPAVTVALHVARCAAVAAAGLACVPATAAAATVIGPDRVVVSTSAGRAVIDPDPFRLKFQDRSGRTLLREVANRLPEGRPLPLTRDPEPFALEREPDHASYSPLGVEFGRERRAQWNAGFWTGDMLFSRRYGSAHFAHRVLNAIPIRGGVRLEVSTSSRRRLLVRVVADVGGSIRVRARLRDAPGVISMADSFVAGPGEGYYGFGGRHGSVNKRGEKLYGWTEQESFGGEQTLRGGVALLPTLIRDFSDYTLEQLNTKVDVPAGIPGGFERYLAPTGPNGAYYPQALFVSSRGFGFMLNQPEYSRWRMGNDRRRAWQVQVSARELDYTVALGPTRRASVRTLTAINGRHRLPPAWAQGPMLVRAAAVPALPGQPAPETRATYQAKIERDLADMTSYGVRPSAYAFEGWALLDMGYVRELIRRLRELGVRSVVYHRAYVSDDALSTQPAGDYQKTFSSGYVATLRAGQPYVFGSNGGAPATLLDFKRRATLRWWRERLELLLDAGADGFMQDFGEQVQDGMSFADGSTGKTMHNRYPVIFHRASRRIADAWARRHPRRGVPWFFTRAGYSGRPGSAAYEMGNFPGDETADWGAGSGLRSLGPDMLNRAVGGAFGYTTDIGGYVDLLTGAPNAELYTRWTEWSALTPYFRVHNSSLNGTRMPWAYGPEVLARWKTLAALHQRALPLIRRLWRQGRRTGLPPTRPLWLSAPEAPGAHDESQEWLLGRDVLVAPVVTEGARHRAVSFPRGCWAGPAGGRQFHGPARIRVAAPLGVLPYFFRCGTRPF